MSDASRGALRAWTARAAVAALALGIPLSPVPDGLTAPAWYLFAIFAATIVAVVLIVVPILTASVFAAASAVLAGLLPPAAAFAGFSDWRLPNESELESLIDRGTAFPAIPAPFNSSCPRAT